MLTVVPLHLPYSVEEEVVVEEEEEQGEAVLGVEEQEIPVKKKKKKDKKKRIKEEPLSEEEPCTSTAIPVCLFLISITLLAWAMSPYFTLLCISEMTKPLKNNFLHGAVKIK